MTYGTIHRGDSLYWRYTWDRYHGQIRLSFKQHSRDAANEQLPWLVDKINASGFFGHGGFCKLSDDGRDLVFDLGKDMFRILHALSKPVPLPGVSFKTQPYLVREQFEAMVLAGIPDYQKRHAQALLNAASLSLGEGSALLDLIRQNLPPEGDLGDHGASAGGSAGHRNEAEENAPRSFVAAVGQLLPRPRDTQTPEPPATEPQMRGRSI